MVLIVWFWELKKRHGEIFWTPIEVNKHGLLPDKGLNNQSFKSNLLCETYDCSAQIMFMIQLAFSLTVSCRANAGDKHKIVIDLFGLFLLVFVWQTSLCWRVDESSSPFTNWIKCSSHVCCSKLSSHVFLACLCVCFMGVTDLKGLIVDQTHKIIY